MHKIVGLCGSLRSGSITLMALNTARDLYGACHYTQGDINLPLYNGDIESTGIPASVAQLANLISDADGVIIASPEYNKAIPGGLKNAFDWISRVPGGVWANKPVATLSAAAGRSGGEAGLYHLRHCLLPFGAHLITAPTVCIGQSSEQFNDQGQLINDRYRDAITKLMTALAHQISQNKSAA